MRLLLSFSILFLIVLHFESCNSSENKQPINRGVISNKQINPVYLSLNQLINIFSIHRKSKESLQNIIGQDSTIIYRSLQDRRVICLLNENDSLVTHNSLRWNNEIYYTFHDKVLYESIINQIKRNNFNKVVDEIDKKYKNRKEHVLGYTQKGLCITLQDKYLMDDTVLGYRIILMENPFYKPK